MTAERITPQLSERCSCGDPAAFRLSNPLWRVGAFNRVYHCETCQAAYTLGILTGIMTGYFTAQYRHTSKRAKDWEDE